MNKNKLWLLLLILLPNLYVIAQDFDIEKQYNWFDTTIGIENTGLYNGVAYIDVEKAKGEFKKFLYNNGFQSGSIDYDGQTYYNIPLKYDVFNDEVILQLTGENGTTILQPFKELIKSFHITNRSFKKIVNKSTENKDDDLSGFYEELLKTSQLVVFKKHRKKRLKRIKEETIMYLFKPKKPYYFLLYQNMYYSVKNKRDFIQLFPDYKKEINSLGIDGLVKRDNPDAGILAYAKQINTLLSKQ
ncbi:hypothetical protein [Marixanthomonas spongiae]|uniref:Uncharacterized protein n=1 Tax=Marixanthomonas spongiae TaxID=2174845 RepID=A0A2U0HYH1_9FLAO|nr:hypothetical protein [Marixanthomonas spongiae]PVW13876.1 hypothetical protein DDV96_12040 [Marixanthomonas spongiae]